MDKFNILAIESSCDDTCASVISDFKILSNVINTQKIHKHFGGVVPELASRNHMYNIASTVKEALQIANIDKKDLSAVAVTTHPGLNGPLLVGSLFAKGYSYGLNIPLIPINHLHGHMLANLIDNDIEQLKLLNKNNIFPFLCLVVSGGNSQIYIVRSFTDFELLGETLDDAIGEAYDKVAKMLGLEYPGGPKIDKLAQLGDKNKFKNNFSKAHISGYNYSFSGFKTSVKYFLEDKLKEDKDFINNNLNDLCASVQECLLNMILEKFVLAIKNTNMKHIAIGGGVASNNGLRLKLKEIADNMNLTLHIPERQYCTDNAAMIAITSTYYFLSNHQD